MSICLEVSDSSKTRTATKDLSAAQTETLKVIAGELDLTIASTLI